MSRRIVLAAAALAMPAAAPAATCTVSASGVTFGVYDPLATGDTIGNGVVTVSCNTLVAIASAYTIAITPGSGSYAARTMISGSGQLSYNIYTDSTGRSVWGDGTGGSASVSDSVLLAVGGTTKTYTAYGRIPARQTMVASGSYADTVVVTIAY